MMKSANTFCQKVPTPRDLKLKNSGKSLNFIGRSERIRTSDPLLPKPLFCVANPSKNVENRHFSHLLG